MTTLTSAPVYDVYAVSQLFGGLGYSLGEVHSLGDPPWAVEGYVTFLDPGWSILRLRDAVAGKRIFYSQHWFANEPFAKLEEPPRYRQLQMKAVRGSFGKTFPEQQALVPADMEIPTARVVLTAMVIHFLATGKRLFPNYYVRCVDQTSGGGLVSVGYFDPGGVGVYHWEPRSSDDDLGVVLARKF